MSHAPDQDLVTALEAAGCTVRGSSVVCVFHGDTNASGSIYPGGDGRSRYKCFGCEVKGDAADIIARHTGRPLSEVLKERNGSANMAQIPPRNGQDNKPQRSFATVEELAKDIYHQTPEAIYRYTDQQGQDILAVLRLPEKQFRQARWTADGWQSGGVGEPSPLYRQSALAGDVSAVVVVTEGEKDTDALAALGIMATTAPMGADSVTCLPEKDGKPGKVDWSPLAGRTVVLFGDDDEPGHKHMARVARCLSRLNPPPMISIVRVEDHQGCKDAADLIAAHGADAVRQAVAQAVPWSKPATLPSFDLQTFADTPEGTLSWVWHGVIPCGMLSLIAGKQGLGKSFVMCDLAARVSTGSPMPDGKQQQAGNVLMLVREDHASLVLRPRMIAAGADLTRIRWSTFSSIETGSPMDLTKHVAELSETVTANKIGFIIVDTFAAFAPAGTDSNSSQSVREVLDPLTLLARQTGAAVVVVAHLRKSGQGEGEAMDAIAGSAQMTAGVRVASMLESGSVEGERWFRVVKSNLGKSNSAGWTFGFQSTGNAASGDVPKIVWKVASEAYQNADADRRAGQVTIDPGLLRNSLLAAVAKRPLTIKEASHQTWKLIKRTSPSVRKMDVDFAVEDLAAEASSCFEVGQGSKGARLIGLPGKLPELPEAKARRLATPGMTVDELVKVAGCRKAVACDVLRELS